MLHGKIDASSPQLEPSASSPTHCEAWIQLQSAVNEDDGRINVGLEVTEDKSTVTERVCIVTSSPKRSPSKINADLAVPLLILDPAIQVKTYVALGCLSESQSIVRVKLERLPEEIECAQQSLPFD